MIKPKHEDLVCPSSKKALFTQKKVTLIIFDTLKISKKSLKVSKSSKFHQTFGLSSAPGNVELATGVLSPAFVAQLLPAASAPRKQNSENVFVEEEK
jgi:hypothetical protein